MIIVGLMILALEAGGVVARQDSIAPGARPPSVWRTSEGPGRWSALLEAEYFIEAKRVADSLVTAARFRARIDSLELARAIDLQIETRGRAHKRPDPEWIESADEVVRLKERWAGPADPELIPSLINAGRILKGRSEYTAATTALGRAVTLAERLWGQDDARTGAVLRDLGILHDAAGRYDLAEPLYVRVIGILERSLGPDAPEVAVALNDLAWLRLELEGPDLEDARRMAERALTILQRSPPLRRHDLPRSLRNLGLYHWYANGDLERFEDVSQEALTAAMRHPGPDSIRLFRPLIALRGAAYFRGELGMAALLTDRALRIAEIAERGIGPDLAFAYGASAWVAQAMEDTAKAARLYPRAIAMYEATLGPEHPRLTLVLNDYSRVLESAGQAPQAEALLRRTLAICERSKNCGLRHAAEARELLARQCSLRGLTAEAGTLYRRALGELRSARNPGDPIVLRTMHGYADHLQATGEHDSAAALYRAVLAHGSGSLRVQRDVLESRIRLALDLAMRGGLADAVDLSLEAERDSRDGVRLMMQAASEREALLYAAHRPSGVSLALALAARSREVRLGAVRRIWDEVIRSRAVVLDELARRTVAIQADSTVSLAAREWQAARQRLANRIVRGRSGPRSEEEGGEVGKLRAIAEQAERELSDRSSSFRTRRLLDAAGFAEMSASLSRGSALVAFVLYTEPLLGRGRAASAYAAFVCGAGDSSPVFVPIGPAARVDSLLRAWRQASGSADAGPLTASGRRVGAELRRQVWDPIAPHVRGRTAIFVVPDGELNLLNPATLPWGRSSFLLEADAVFHILSSERDVIGGAAPRRDGRGMLAMGAVEFDGPGRARPGRTGTPSLTRRPQSTCGDLASLHFRSLLATGREVEDVVAAWRGQRGTSDEASSVTKLTGRDASEGAFKRVAPSSRSVHVATHGFFLGSDCGHGGGRVENPLLRSGIALAGANDRSRVGPDEDDGILTAEELSALDLSAVDLLVLSSCEGGVGSIMASEGVFGLRRALRIAGARTLIMSLGRVADAGAQAWMREFYAAHLQRGEATAIACRSASLALLRRQRRGGHPVIPAIWGAFVSAGTP